MVAWASFREGDGHRRREFIAGVGRVGSWALPCMQNAGAVTFREDSGINSSSTCGKAAICVPLPMPLLLEHLEGNMRDTEVQASWKEANEHACELSFGMMTMLGPTDPC